MMEFVERLKPLLRENLRNVRDKSILNNLPGKFTSGGRNEFGITLSPPFRRKKIVVSTFFRIRIFAANRRTGLINGALTFLLIEKLADLTEDMVLLVSQHESIRRCFGVFPLCLFIRDTEVLCYAQEVALGHFDSIVTAAIGRTLGTVVHHSKCTRAFAVRTTIYAHSAFLDGAKSWSDKVERPGENGIRRHNLISNSSDS